MRTATKSCCLMHSSPGSLLFPLVRYLRRLRCPPLMGVAMRPRVLFPCCPQVQPAHPYPAHPHQDPEHAERRPWCGARGIERLWCCDVAVCRFAARKKVDVVLGGETLILISLSMSLFPCDHEGINCAVKTVIDRTARMELVTWMEIVQIFIILNPPGYKLSIQLSTS